MQCPVDNTELTLSERQGIEIDYCPKCRGVWLDRGEIDKLIERGLGQQPHHEQRRYDDDDDFRGSHERNDHHYNDRNEHHNNNHHKKRESWLGELFD